MMHPVLRVLVERAAGKRISLVGLASVIPGGFWVRRLPGDDWTAREHLVHALTADAAVAEFIAGKPERSSLEAARTEAMSEAVELSLPELLERAAAGRSRLFEVLSEMTAADLERELPVPGAANAWGEQLSITVFQYLEQWAAHDAVHEDAIREAIATSPDLTAIAMTRRRR